METEPAEPVPADEDTPWHRYRVALTASVIVALAALAGGMALAEAWRECRPPFAPAAQDCPRGNDALPLIAGLAAASVAGNSVLAVRVALLARRSEGDRLRALARDATAFSAGIGFVWGMLDFAIRFTGTAPTPFALLYPIVSMLPLFTQRARDRTFTLVAAATIPALIALAVDWWWYVPTAIAQSAALTAAILLRRAAARRTPAAYL